MTVNYIHSHTYTHIYKYGIGKTLWGDGQKLEDTVAQRWLLLKVINIEGWTFYSLIPIGDEKELVRFC